MPFLRENSGRWSPEKIIAFVGACIPALWLAWRAWNGELNPARPVNEAIHDTGSWAVRFLLLSLAVSPARRLFAAPKLINMRRTLGVTAFCYAALHLSLYFVQEKFDLWKIASEIGAAATSAISNAEPVVVDRQSLSAASVRIRSSVFMLGPP